MEPLKILLFKYLYTTLYMRTNSNEISFKIFSNPQDGIRSLFVPDNDEEGNVLKLGSALNSSSATSRPSKFLFSFVRKKIDIKYYITS